MRYAFITKTKIMNEELFEYSKAVEIKKTAHDIAMYAIENGIGATNKTFEEFIDEYYTKTQFAFSLQLAYKGLINMKL
jgi:hypothetical protein